MDCQQLLEDFCPALLSKTAFATEIAQSRSASSWGCPGDQLEVQQKKLWQELERTENTDAALTNRTTLHGTCCLRTHLRLGSTRAHAPARERAHVTKKGFWPERGGFVLCECGAILQHITKPLRPMVSLQQCSEFTGSCSTLGTPHPHRIGFIIIIFLFCFSFFMPHHHRHRHRHHDGVIINRSAPSCWHHLSVIVSSSSAGYHRHVVIPPPPTPS